MIGAGVFPFQPACRMIEPDNYSRVAERTFLFIACRYEPAGAGTMIEGIVQVPCGWMKPDTRKTCRVQ